METPNNTKNLLIKIDTLSVVKILLILIILFVFYLIRDIVFIFIAAIIISFIFSPIVDGLEKRRVPRIWGTIFVYLTLLVIFVGIIVPLVPIFSREVDFLIEKVPAYYERLNQYVGGSDYSWSGIGQRFLLTWFNKIDWTGYGLFSLLGTFLGGLLVIIAIFIIAFYITIQKDSLGPGLKFLIPSKYRNDFSRLIDLIQKDIGAWSRSLLILCLIVGTLDYIGLTILGVKLALALAVIAGLFELIPFAGPWLAGILAILVTFTQSPLQALMVAILFLVVQQIEANFITPNIMKKAIGLNPLLTILMLLIGAKLAGPLGIVLSVPIATICIILVKEYLRIRNNKVPAEVNH